ncbi:uncharacterized protein LOC119996983 [Tripterygium wilfordii]|uniref:uncharacterized protein LOC119996983 n=1 Tax=Tripterygium wilfordii TaxID=458696 RepID=UPI0018F82292|nr:uncharacterized protein LOC119996983 [Tripterygium wilfordii]
MSDPYVWPNGWQFVEQYVNIQQQELEEIAMVQQVVEELEKLEPPRVCQRTFIRRDRAKAHNDLVMKYFAPDCIFPPRMFHRRFRMRRELLHNIIIDLEESQPYFRLKYDCVGRPGFSSIQKMTAALRVLAYGSPIDREDDALMIAQITAIDTYLQAPNEADLARLLAENEARGFPDMIGSLDCMHWEWHNCPTAWHGQFVGHTGRLTLILEAVASMNLWIWHAFFGMAGTYNDISVLDHSPLFDRFIQCQTPQTPYKAIKHPRTEKEKHFARKQEAARKDVERAFGVLQAKWAITQGPVRFWDTETIKNIMQCYIILHNMIIEDERHLGIEPWQPLGRDSIPDNLLHHNEEWLGTYIHSRMQQVRDKSINGMLRRDLMDHLWTNFGGESSHS